MLFIEAIFGNSRKMETIQISMKGNLGGQMTMDYTKEYYTSMLVNTQQPQPSTGRHLINTVRKQVPEDFCICTLLVFIQYDATCMKFRTRLNSVRCIRRWYNSREKQKNYSHKVRILVSSVLREKEGWGVQGTEEFLRFYSCSSIK